MDIRGGSISCIIFQQVDGFSRHRLLTSLALSVMDMISFGAQVGAIYIPFLFALCFHEFSHAWMAKKRGDNTAEMMGRLTMNPLAHMDIVGTLVLPLMSLAFGSSVFFGWAKPVPFNYRNLKNPRVDAFWIALAGPMSNFLLAIISAFAAVAIEIYALGHPQLIGVKEILSRFLVTNLFLGFFNALPVHPLDGGKIIARFLPSRWNYFLEQNESWTGLILMFLIFTGMLSFLVYPVLMTAEYLLRFAGAIL